MNIENRQPAQKCEEKIEIILVVGPFYPNNSYIVQRRITTGDIESRIKVCSRENKKKAKTFAEGLCERRGIEFGGFDSPGFMECEPIR